ncbi:hypothetical protein D3C87_787510 [compost metagenome]
MDNFFQKLSFLLVFESLRLTVLINCWTFELCLKIRMDNFFQKLSFLFVFESLRLTIVKS